MFTGATFNTIDAKGRVVIPQKFRDTLSETGFVITRGMDGCVYVYPKPRFQELTEKLMQMQSTGVETRKLARFLLAFAEEGEFDAQGRICVSQPLREYAGLKKEILTTGILDRIEIWDRERWNKYSEENLEGPDFNEAVIGFDF
ncbi:MAG: division/cell wall cluster transcriptional repressor MraZ [Clostridiaceae bacterium]|nr:division/cell wall cluster transcriptional repressor MraZ [Clostridiaceae bacterium]